MNRIPTLPPSREPVSRARAASDTVLIAVVCGLGGGLVHVLASAVHRFVLDGFTWWSRDFAWMIPLSFTIFFLAAAVPVALVAAAVPRLLTPPRLVLLFGSAAALGVLLPYSQIARYAAAILALGVGVQLMRSTPAETSRARRSLRRIGWSLGGVVVLALVATRAVALSASLRATRTTGVPPAGAPSVLLIILDTVRAANLGLYGYGRPTTPHLERWMQRGVVFDRAFSPAPWTLPTHGALFTGHYGGELSGDWKVPLDASRRTLAEAFRGAGYATAAFAANLDYTTWESGLARGFTYFSDYNTSLRQLLASSPIAQTVSVREALSARSPLEAVRALAALNFWIDPKHWGDRTTARQITDRFLDWEARVNGVPYFAFLNYFDAHGPYDPEPEFRAAIGGTEAVDAYDAAIATIDAHLDRLFRALEARGRLDNTVVVVTSDHGELFGEHGLWGHAHNMYLDVLHVPLAMRGPGIPAGTRVNAEVSLVDMAATISALALGPGTERFPGQSLASHWENGVATRPALAEVSRTDNVKSTYPTSRGAMKSVIADGHHYIRNGDGIEELFDYVSDRGERRDLVAADSTRVRRMRFLVDSILSARSPTP